MEIREVRPGDAPVWRAAVASILAEEDRDGRLASDAEIEAAVHDPACILLLALSEQRPIGLLSAYVFPDVAAGGRLAYLYDIEVLAAHRRAGIGSALVRALKDECAERGVRLVWAGTEADNRAARRTFERTDAERVGEAYAEYEWEID